MLMKKSFFISLKILNRDIEIYIQKIEQSKILLIRILNFNTNDDYTIRIYKYLQNDLSTCLRLRSFFSTGIKQN